MATPSTSAYSPSAYDPSSLYGRFGANPPKGVKRNPDDPETGNQTTPGASPATSQSPAATPTPAPQQTNVGAPPPPPAAAPAGGSPGQPLGSTPMAGAPAAASPPQNPFRTVAPPPASPAAAPSGRINEFAAGDGNANGITGAAPGGGNIFSQLAGGLVQNNPNPDRAPMVDERANRAPQPPDQNPGLAAIGAGFNPQSGGPSAPQAPPPPLTGPGGYDRSKVDLSALNAMTHQASGSTSMDARGNVTGNDPLFQIQGKQLRGEPLTETERAYVEYHNGGPTFDGQPAYSRTNNEDGTSSMAQDTGDLARWRARTGGGAGGPMPGNLPPAIGDPGAPFHPVNAFDQIAPQGARGGPPPAPNFTGASPSGGASTDPYFPTGTGYAAAPGTVPPPTSSTPPKFPGPGGTFVQPGATAPGGNGIGPGPGPSSSNSGDPHLDALMSQFGVHGGPASRFDDPVIQQAWNRMSGNIDDQYDAGDRAQRADLARRGISDSTAGSAILRGRNVDRRTAKEDQSTQLAIASASARNADLTGATNRALGMYGAGQGTNRFNQTFGQQRYMDKNYYDANRQDAYDRLMMQMFGAGQ